MSATEPGLLRVYFMDVGYGDAALISLPDSSLMLVDAGGENYSRQVISTMEGIGAGDIETVIITHPHRNHFGGLSDIARRFPPKRVIVNGDPNFDEGYEELLAQLRAANVPVVPLGRGQKIDSHQDVITVDILHPAGMTGNPNNNSLVMRLKYKDITVLLMGDVELEAQDVVIDAVPDIGAADVIKIPHHGGPLSEKFIGAFQGKVFIVSTGPNAWGLPDQGRLDQLRGTVYRTDHEGTVLFESNGTAFSVAPINVGKE